MRRYFSLITAVALLLVVLVLPATVSLCSQSMAAGAQANHPGSLHQLLDSCQPTDWVTWVERFASQPLTKVLVGMAMTMAVVTTVVMPQSLVLGLDRYERHRHQRNPHDFVLELLAQGILHPRVPRV